MKVLGYESSQLVFTGASKAPALEIPSYRLSTTLATLPVHNTQFLLSSVKHGDMTGQTAASCHFHFVTMCNFSFYFIIVATLVFVISGPSCKHKLDPILAPAA